MDAQELKATLLDLKSRLEDIKVNVFQIEDKKKRLEEIENELSQEKVWSDLELSQKLSKEKTNLQKIISKYQTVDQKVSDSEVLIDISIEEKDDSAIKEVNQEVLEIFELVEDFEFSRMFNKKMDGSSAFIEIQAGSGGTEAQDWAEMLMRMYSKWAESRGFNIKVVEISHGDVAGIKSASIYVDGDHAYGWLRTETGIHRLVRKSPFDSGNRRHTSFASVFISPEVDDSIVKGIIIHIKRMYFTNLSLELVLLLNRLNSSQKQGLPLPLFQLILLPYCIQFLIFFELLR